VILDKDACEFCKMNISDAHFMTELITQKGRVYKFDDISCMLKYAETVDKGTIKNFYVGNVEKSNEFIDATTAWYITHTSYKSPMGGNTAAFATKEAAVAQANKITATAVDWNTLHQNSEKKEASSHEGHDH
ncbi:MAG: nitrous oxide reductase accessory protein NosL, partial [Ferruginibacter sp.]